MARHDHILLIGLRGSGKSTLGAALAKRTRSRFVDLDDVTPELLGRSTVADVFERDGEAAFREAEVEALRQSLVGPRSVIALGGGTPTAPGAAAIFESDDSVTVVYLRAEAETLRSRLEGTDVAARPSLTGAGTLDEIEQVLADRDALYRSLADKIVTIDGLEERDVLELLVSIAFE